MTLVIGSVDQVKAYLGRELGVSEWLKVTQERINRFAEATEDRQWIHVNPERAQRESPYGAAIAHGFLTLSLLGFFVKQILEIRGVRLAVNYGLNRVRFPEAVREGSRIRARVGVAAVEDRGGAVEVTLLVTIEVEGREKPCCVAEWLVLYYPERDKH